MIAGSVCEPPLKTPARLDGLLTNLRLRFTPNFADAEFRDAAKSTDEVDTPALLWMAWVVAATVDPTRRPMGRGRSSFPSDSYSFEPVEFIATESGLPRRLAAIPLTDGKDE
jgi:hypothetical protein